MAANSNKWKSKGEKAKKTVKQNNAYPASSNMSTHDIDTLLGMSQKEQQQQLIDLIHRQGGPLAVNKFFQQIGVAPPKPGAALSKPAPQHSLQAQLAQAPGISKRPQRHKQEVKKVPPSNPAFQKAKPVPTQPVCPIPATNASYSVPGTSRNRAASVLDNKSSEYPAGKLSPIDDVIRRINTPNHRILVLMRGCPGSGKTTLAKKLKHNGVIIGADDFFMSSGKYVYDAFKLPEAHANTRFQTLAYMQKGISPIIIDNTNLETWEMEPYMMQAVKLRYFVALIEPDTSWRYNARMLAQLNTHQVPFDKIGAMLQKFDHSVNVHVLRKMVQPKIDVYKQQKVALELQRNAESSANDIIAGLLSQESKNEPSTTTNKATPFSRKHLRRGRSLGSSSHSHHELSSDEELDISNTDYGLYSSSVLQPIPVALIDTGKSSHQSRAAKSEPHELSQNMRDLMDISFVESLNLEDKPRENNDWKLPPFPGSLAKIKSTSLLSVDDVGRAQAVSKMTDHLKDNNVGNAMPKSLGQKSLDSKKLNASNDESGSSTPTKPKSGIENGLDAIRREDAVRTLKVHFSSVSTGDLEDLVARCDGDVHWAANLLLDSGYKWLQTSDNEPANSVGIDSNDDTDDANDDVSEMDAKASSEETDSAPLTMRIDSIFGMQLEQLFGPVGFHVATESYYGNDLNLEIDLKTARKIYSYWSRSLAKKFEQEEDALKEMLNDESYAERLQEVEDANIAAKLDAEERDPNFPALTTAALLLDAQAKYPETTEGLASKIKRHQLYEVFPKIDRKAIDNVFNAHGGNLMDTTQAIEASLRPHEKPGLVIAPEMREYCEKTWLKIAQQESLLLYDKKNEGEALQSVVDPSYDDLRAEATVHYHRRQECFAKAQEALGKNMKAVASFYSQQGHLHTQKLYEANKRAKQIILTKTNAGQKNNTLDLHMLYVQEAMEALTNFLDQKKRELNSGNATSLTLILITGKGVHSENLQPRIKPAVVDFLQRHNYSICDVNGGVIEVNLTRADLG